MSFFIPDKLLEELNDQDQEVRRDALINIKSLIENNILFYGNDSGSDEISVVNLGLLVKKLIRYFGFSPVLSETVVLDLLLLIFQREDFLNQITNRISIERIKKELKKVSGIVCKQASLEKLEMIDAVLVSYEHSLRPKTNGHNDTVDELSSMISKLSVTDHTKPQLAQESLESAFSMSFSRCNLDCSSNSWEILDENNMETFELLHNAFTDFENPPYLEYSLNFLASLFNDFPVEFYLQPPYLFEDLINLLPHVSSNLSVTALKIIRRLTNSLKTRLISLQELSSHTKKAESSKNMICVKKFINSLMNLAVVHLRNIAAKEMVDLKNEEFLLELYRLLSDLVDFVQDANEICEIYLNELLDSLAKAVKSIRVSYENLKTNSQKLRVHYVILSYLMNQFIALCNTNEMSRTSGHNLWEEECDILLIDVPFKTFMPSIYKLLKRNRMETIKTDEYLETLLGCRKSWMAAVEIFKSNGEYRDEDVLIMGAQALETFQIHKSLDLVKFLFLKISSCSQEFTRNKELQKTAEEIFLKMLAHPWIEARKIIYKMAANSIQEKFSDNFERVEMEVTSSSKSLTCLMGFPLTLEIIVELLCFGLNNADQEIHENAQKILYIVMRGKCVFERNWNQILEVIKPVLPLFTSIGQLNEQLGMFALEIYCQENGFSDDELIQAYQRFLYCDSYMIRDISSRKLKLVLEKREFPDYLLEILSSNSLMLNDSQVTELFDIPSSTLPCDPEKSRVTLDLLKQIDRTNVEMIKTILLQLKSFMNSMAACQLIHDQHAWVYIVECLHLSVVSPSQPEILKLSIEILYKLCITILSFRQYLSTEYNVQNCLLKAIAYYNDDPQIKKYCSILLFLFLFNDFFVGNEKNLSLPVLMTNLKVPFKCNVHWVESPFSQTSRIEALFMSIEEHLKEVNIKETCWRFLKFTFAGIWFEKLENLENDGEFGLKNYLDVAENKQNVFGFNRELLLTKNDLRYLDDLNELKIFKSILRKFENVVKFEEVFDAILDVERLLILPIDIEEQTPKLLRKFERHLKFIPAEKDAVQVYEKLSGLVNFFLVMENQDAIVWSIQQFMQKKSAFLDVLTNFKCPIYIQVASILKNTLKSFENWSRETVGIMKELEIERKFLFFGRLFEILSLNLDVEIKDSEDMSHLISTIETLRQLLVVGDPVSDDTFSRSVVRKAFKLAHTLYKPNQCISNTIKNLLTINLCLIKSIKYFELQPKELKLLFSLCGNRDYLVRILIWDIFAHCAFKKDYAVKFVREFDTMIPDGLFSLVFDKILDKSESVVVKSGAVAVLGVLIDVEEKKQVTTNGVSTPGKLADAYKSKNFCKMLLDNLLIDDSITIVSLKCYCYIIKKFIQQDSIIISDMLSQQIIQTIFRFISNAKFLDSLSAITMMSDACDLIIFCWKLEGFRTQIHESIISMKNEYINDLFNVMKMALIDQNPMVCDLRSVLNKNVLNVLYILMTSEQGNFLIKSFLENPDNCETLVRILAIGLKTQNRYSDIYFHLTFVKNLLDSTENYQDSVIYPFEFQPVPDGLLNDITNFKFHFKSDTKQMNTLPNNTLMQENWFLVKYLVDLIIFEVVDIYDFVDFSKYSFEYKHDMKALCYLILKSFSRKSERLGLIFDGFDVITLIYKKLNLTLLNLGGGRYLETTKKIGHKKCIPIIKELGLLIRILTDWKINLRDKRIKEMLLKLMKIFDWIEADSYLLNSFYNLLNSLSCFRVEFLELFLETFDGCSKPIYKSLLEKMSQLTTKPPHTENNLMMLQNGLNVLKNASNYMEVRLLLRNASVFRVLDQLHPQLGKVQTTWDQVAIAWLVFYEIYSRFEDADCQVSQISVLCRFARFGNPTIRELALRTIRNFSLKAAIGYVLLSSDDFLQTVDIILSKPNANEEKYLCAMTLLSIASKCERLKAKIKNSFLNMKLKNQLTKLQCESSDCHKLFNCISILIQVLHPND